MFYFALVFAMFICLNFLYLNFLNLFLKGSIMSWNEEKDILFCREILVSKLFSTKNHRQKEGKSGMTLQIHSVNCINQFSG